MFMNYNNDSLKNKLMTTLAEVNNFDRIFPMSFSPFCEELKTDIKEFPDKYEMTVAVPGIDKSDIDINVENDVFTLTVESKHETNEDENNKYVIRERSYGKMVRSFKIPDVDAHNIKASLNQGILSIILPKKEPSTNKTKIEISWKLIKNRYD